MGMGMDICDFSGGNLLYLIIIVIIIIIGFLFGLYYVILYVNFEGGI